MNLVKSQIPSGYCVRISFRMLEICLATIGVCVFRCADFGWRTFYILNGGQKYKPIKNYFKEHTYEKNCNTFTFNFNGVFYGF